MRAQTSSHRVRRSGCLLDAVGPGGLLGLLGLVPLLGGCPQPIIARPYAAPATAEVLARVQQHRDAVRSLRARAKADYLAERGERVKVDIAVAASRPESLRLAGESTFTGPLLTLATNGSDFQLLDVQQNRFLSGRVNPCNMARLIRVALHPSEALDVLLGGSPVLGDADKVELSWDGRNGGREVLTFTDARKLSLAVRLDAARQSWDVREAELRDAAGTVLWRVRHEDFHALGPDGSALDAGDPTAALAPRLPAVTYIEDPPHKADVRLRWREREINPPLDAGLFRLEAPAGVPTEPDTCQDFPPPAPAPGAAATTPETGTATTLAPPAAPATAPAK